MKFKEFCEKALSNDVICVTDDIIYGKPIHESVAAYRFLDDKKRPDWAENLMEHEVKRFTYGKCAKDYPHTHLIVQL